MIKGAQWNVVDSQLDFIKIWLESDEGDIITVGNFGDEKKVAKYEMRISYTGKNYVRGLPTKVFQTITPDEALDMAEKWVALQSERVQ